MESVLEQQRRCHEERERLMDAMVGESLMIANQKSKAAAATSHRDMLNSEHRTRMMLDRYVECTSMLKDLYDDKDGQRKEEVAALSGPNEFQEFYARLKQIKEFHRRHPGESISVPMSVEFEELKRMREGGSSSEDANVLVEFTDEEGYGKYLDLHECYEKYVNLKGVERVDYVSFLGLFDTTTKEKKSLLRLFEIPREKKGGNYKNFLYLLLDYLYDYLRRVKPLFDVNEEIEAARKEVDAKFEKGEFPGWHKEASSGALAHTGAHLDLSAFSSWEELASLGLDRLKSALLALGLKCGGTLEERARRLFATKGKSLNELDPNLFAKSKPGGAKGLEVKAKDVERQKEVAMMEAQVFKLADLLSEHRKATVENVSAKQARTVMERDESEEELSEPENEEEANDDDIPYNPKNLPLGWDGKPIPYWLYKLHGLNISYNCEICGNFTYKGPKAFQRHFAEWRHAHGMRCLGIPNTAHFANVTQIEDAMSLWEKLKAQKQEEAWKPEHEEEFEDSQGNVVSRKIYEDLRRQGLL